MLLQERQAKGFSLIQLGRKINIKPQVLHAIEKGKTSVNSERAHVIAKFFNKPIDYFFVGTYYRVRE
ncbi:helix-turn-helix domain-containing protein [Bacillus thuringiensis]|uniref:XRE family transcriptional regulator n=1 Tax=Bacillus cereus TaxID=1396 RepID=A0A9X7M131_BACCE|nr:MULTISPECIES: helix-turn-helix transcriptional regulator [Bacillus cereus group]MBG9517032.1 XRE family transcriptional regulator [Bacillus thuringiensis]MDA2638018.1 helix-turn-helix transcriptional regulator [Bacillus cereus]QDZ76865.1 XRE family transcriptional regulator [Bacillus cereus]TEA80771.1 XRE family transcriptional regulator [Bacillus thuringiensis F14-1]HDR4948836.1 helix-turn-helix transcriptional regulator [Bacillus cereus]